jgi:hypothetical protein
VLSSQSGALDSHTRLRDLRDEFFACPHAHLGRAHGKSCRCVLCCFVCSQADSFSPTRMCLTHGELVPVDQLSFCTGATSWHPAMVPAAGAERRG